MSCQNCLCLTCANNGESLSTKPGKPGKDTAPEGDEKPEGDAPEEETGEEDE